MKLSASIIGLIITIGTSLLASAATATPLSAPLVLGQVAVTPVAAMEHRRAPTPRHRIASSAAREACDPTDASQLYDWGRYGISHNPCWPCVRGEESATSAYPSWEVWPNCE